MTREEAIYLLDNLIGFVEDNHGSDYDEALKLAIKALKQEPFINKPCVSEKVCEYDKNVVLDKIRAEITEEVISHSGTGEEVIEAYIDGLKKTLQIIDKYKTESEYK